MLKAPKNPLKYFRYPMGEKGYAGVGWPFGALYSNLRKLRNVYVYSIAYLEWFSVLFPCLLL